MRNKLITLLLILMAVLSAPALANETTNTDAQAILSQQQEIKSEVMSKKGRYRDMGESTREQLFNHQDKVQKLLVGISQTTELGEHDRIALFNSLEAIEAIVNKAEDDRIVCERHKPSGSNRPVTVCKSVAERRADKEHAEQTLQRNQTCINCSR